MFKSLKLFDCNWSPNDTHFPLQSILFLCLKLFFVLFYLFFELRHLLSYLLAHEKLGVVKVSEDLLNTRLNKPIFLLIVHFWVDHHFLMLDVFDPFSHEFVAELILCVL